MRTRIPGLLATLLFGVLAGLWSFGLLIALGYGAVAWPAWVGFAAGGVLAHWGLRRGAGCWERPTKQRVAMLAVVAWLGVGAVFWSLRTSSLGRPPAMLVLLLVVGLAPLAGLLWPVLPGARRSRAALLAGLGAMSMAALTLVHSPGLDGEARVMLAWRTATIAVGPTAAAATPQSHAIVPVEAAGHGVSSSEYRGSGRAGIVPREFDLDWVAHPPRELWRRPVGAGWGSFAVVDGLAITQEQLGEQEAVVCYDPATGRPLWTHSDAAAFRSPLAGDGPRATPTIHGGTVYTLGATGILNALDLANGRRLWSTNVLTDCSATPLEHGVCGSPLVVDSLVIVSSGGRGGRAFAAYDRATGVSRWQVGDEPAGYGSPLVAQVLGERQILLLTATDLIAHDPATGRRLWSHAWRNEQQTNCAQPIVLGGEPCRIVVSTGYGQGTALLEISRSTADDWSVREAWTSRDLESKFSSPLAIGNRVVGLDNGILAALDLTTGRRLWKRGRYGHGQVLLAEDTLLVQSESGPVLLVDPDEVGPRELARLDALAGKTWNYPTLAGRLLLVRNDHEAACFELPGR